MRKKPLSFFNSDRIQYLLDRQLFNLSSLIQSEGDPEINEEEDNADNIINEEETEGEDDGLPKWDKKQ